MLMLFKEDSRLTITLRDGVLAWVRLSHGRITDASPSLTYTSGWTLKKLRDTARRQGWSIHEQV